jgi:Carboxypeptidase regulatory-like domain
VRLLQFTTWAIVLGLSLPACAAEHLGAISGYVRNVAGDPQMGAVIEILGAADRTIVVFSDGAGYYAASGLIPGLYSLKVSAPSFLPKSQERVGIRAGASIHLNFTLNTLLDALQLGPARTMPDDDDWKWTLRSVANRPILRVVNDPNAPAEKQDHELRGSLSFLAGSTSEGYGSGSDMSTAFTLERGVLSDGHLTFAGDLGYGQTSPNTSLRATFSNRMPDGSLPSLAITASRFAPSDPNLRNAALQSVALTAGDDLTLEDVLELNFGSQLESIQFLGQMTTFRPYGSADLHLSPNTVLRYQYTMSRPQLCSEKDLGPAVGGFTDSDPRLTVSRFSPQLERAHHQELSFARRIGNSNLQVAGFYDRIGDTALTGAGQVTAAGGYLLPDVASGTFSYNGGALNTGGMRVVVQHKLSSELTATVDYAFGGVLELDRGDVSLRNAQQWITTQRRQAVAAQFNGTIHRTHTQVTTSYRWINGPALTPVDLFNSSPGQSDAFLNVVIRQPIPSMGFLPARMEALIDLRNLLAQGYVPVLGQDGHTVYLVQSARAVRGGLAFSF